VTTHGHVGERGKHQVLMIPGTAVSGKKILRLLVFGCWYLVVGDELFRQIIHRLPNNRFHKLLE
jgi:hypothetical protein